MRGIIPQSSATTNCQNEKLTTGFQYVCDNVFGWGFGLRKLGEEGGFGITTHHVLQEPRGVGPHIRGKDIISDRTMRIKRLCVQGMVRRRFAQCGLTQKQNKVLMPALGADSAAQDASYSALGLKNHVHQPRNG